MRHRNVANAFPRTRHSRCPNPSEERNLEVRGYPDFRLFVVVLVFVLVTIVPEGVVIALVVIETQVAATPPSAP